ncbi:hypothetical protein M6I34_12295 [Burkholderiaceae bacterium FT117]|uniref:hypothetical protein n=1 Tax=Zeimonas sediminis TaxID=2944268 RepID=UPI0023430A97|nr:hypothetical protein [Zeimonas sediminis]MCM5571289.1 hypothetical protein [Zeimonas sediminis]
MIAFRNRQNGLAVASFALAAGLAANLAAAGPSAAAPDARAAEIEARYQRERTFCLAGLTHQDRADCLREAAAARAEARRGLLADPTPPSEYLENALRRCAALPEADRADCEARVRGEGTVEGSVESGGIYRETRTLLPPGSSGK